MITIERSLEAQAYLRKVGDLVATHPEMYDQHVWGRTLRSSRYGTHCGTRACIAGLAVSLRSDFAHFVPGTNRYYTTDGQLQSIVSDALNMFDLINRDDHELGVHNEIGLFSGYWHPVDYPELPLHLAVRNALYQIACGKHVEEVTNREISGEDYE